MVFAMFFCASSLFSFLLILGVLFSGYSVIGQLAFYIGFSYFALLIFLESKSLNSIILFVGFCCLLLISGSASFYEGHELRYTLRYIFITIFVIYMLVFIKSNLGFKVGLVPVIGLFQAIIISLISLYLSVTGSYDVWQVIRQSALSSGIGDIWTSDGFYYRVQLRGNHLIFIAWLVQMILIGVSSGRDKLVTLGLSVGLLAAGNASYIICMFLCGIFLSIRARKLHLYHLLIGISLPFVLYLTGFFSTFMDVLARKFGGVESSNGARLEQLSTIFNAISQNGYYFWGAGAGAPYPIGMYGDTGWRTLTQYLELQTFFYFYKFGLFPGLLLVLVLLLPILLISQSSLRIFYLFYLLGSFLNPYMLDANHLLVLLIISASINRYQCLARGRYA